MSIHLDTGSSMKVGNQLRRSEFTEVYQIEPDFEAKIISEFNSMVEMAIKETNNNG